MALELYINGLQAELGKDSIVAINKQIIDFNTLTELKGDFSNSFTLPNTDNNKRILEHANKVQSLTNLPYVKLPARVIQDGLEVMPEAFCLIDVTGGSFRIVVYSGNSAWGTLIQQKYIKDIDLTAYAHIWDSATIRNSHTNPNPCYIYPVVDYNSLTNLNNINGKLLRPFVKCKLLLERIFNDIGYTVTGDIFNINRFLNAHIECPQSVFPNELFLMEVANLNPYTLNTQIFINGFQQEAFLTFDTEVYDPLQSFAPQGIVQTLTPFTTPAFAGGNRTTYIARKVGTYYFELTINLTHIWAKSTTGQIYPSTYPMSYELRASPNLANTISVIYNNNTATINFSVNITSLASFQNLIFLYVTPANISSYEYQVQINSMNWKCVGYSGSAQSEFGDPIYPNTILPEITQVDFVKAMAYMFGQYITTDNNNKEVRFNSWQNIESNKPYALDWSEKLDENIPPEIRFKLNGWAQNNNFKYQPHETIPVGYGDGKVTINDEWLNAERTVIELPFGATTNNNIGVPEIQRAIILSLTPWAVEWTNDSPPRILTGGINTNSIKIDGVTVSPYFESWFIRAGSGLIENIGFDNSLIPDYYGYLKGVVDKPKVVIVTVYLKTTDVHQFDHSIPVYIAEFGAYFYVNKINNWVNGNTCKVELIRL